MAQCNSIYFFSYAKRYFSTRLPPEGVRRKMYNTAIFDSFHRKRFPSLKREALGAYLTLISLKFSKCCCRAIWQTYP